LGASPTETPGKEWLDEVWKDCNKLLDKENWRAAKRHGYDERRKTEESMASERAKELEEDE
jgi:hypothetical protein